MGLIELEVKLRSDGEREIRDIEAKTEAEVKAILDEIDSAAEREAERVLAEGGARAKISASRVVSDAREAALRNESHARNMILDGVFAEARKRVLSLPDARKAELLVRLSAHPAFQDGGCRVLVDKTYYPLVKGRRINLVSSDLKDFGVVLESKDGLVRMDSRLSVVLERMKPELKPKIAKILFGGL